MSGSPAASQNHPFEGNGRGENRYVLFDAAWYLLTNPEVAKAKYDPLAHYLASGWKEGRNPHPLFDTAWYLENNPEAAKAGCDPLTHYLSEGAARGASPHPLFDASVYQAQCEGLTAHENLLSDYVSDEQNWAKATHILFDGDWYRQSYPEVVAIGRNPLVDYVTEGAFKGRDPHPLFGSAWYLRANPEVGAAAYNPLRHYLGSGWKEGRNPHPLFDIGWYLQANPEVAKAGCEPLAHYLARGWKQGSNPHPLFDSAWYLETNPEVAKAGCEPLAHYLARGWKEGRNPHPLFDIAWYLETNPEVADAGHEPLTHYVASGWKRGRSPHPLFDAAWYLKTNPEVAKAGYEPLRHYLASGWREGRNPHPMFDVGWYLKTNPELAEAGYEPLTHYLASGWREGRNPHPSFDCAWYHARYPETNRPGLNPLEHYVTRGIAAGYLTRSADQIPPECSPLEVPFEIFRAPPSLADREVCLFTLYSAEGRIYDHVLNYLHALKREGLALVVVIATEGLNEPLSADLDMIDGILVRKNHGWDFAAWATALAVFPDLWAARLLVLANDSVYGPIQQEGLSSILRSGRASPRHVVALTDSYQAKRHLMSYFTVVTSSGLKHPAVRAFWQAVRSHRDKQTVIDEYEIRSIERWEKAGVTFDVMFPTSPTSNQPLNPTLDGWRNLIERGFPFVKVQLLRDFADRHDASRWEESFQANPDLVGQIKNHLVACGRNRQVAARPVPSPNPRYVLIEAAKTSDGATPSFRPADEVDLALEVPFRPGSNEIFVMPDKVAVIAHVFYPDFCPELLAYLRNVPVRGDLFISTDTEEKKTQILESLQDYRNGEFEVRICPNVGRDIAPMLVGFRDVFERYDIFLHVHSKRSPYGDTFATWREFLLCNLLGSESKVRSILQLLMAHDVGIVFSQHFPWVRDFLSFGYNFSTMQDLLARCGVELSKDMVLDFPSGSFCWGRSAALAPLLALNLDWSDFPAEAGQTDGTLAHAIERSILYVAERAGYRWAKVADVERVPAEALVPVQGLQDAETALARVHRPLLRNRIAPLDEAQDVAAFSRIAARRDGSERPRLNLIVSTLQAAKMIEGRATAIEIFEELGAKLSPDTDLRIISVSQRIDMQAMLPFQGYRLIPMSAVHDDFPKVVVDASERLRGFLGLRGGDIFIPAAQSTVANALALAAEQEALHGRQQPLMYLTQDGELGHGGAH